MCCVNEMVFALHVFEARLNGKYGNFFHLQFSTFLTIQFCHSHINACGASLCSTFSIIYQSYAASTDVRDGLGFSFSFLAQGMWNGGKPGMEPLTLWTACFIS